MSIKRTVAKGKIDLAGTNFTLPATDSVILGDTNTLSSILSGKANVDSPVFTGTVGIGTTTNTTRMALDIVSTSAMLLPAGTTLQRPATGIKGLLRYNTENNVFEGFSGSWLTVGSAVTTPVGITGVSVSGNSWIVTTNNGSGALGVHVTFADDPVVYTASFNPQMTGENLPAGYVASANSYITNFEPWKAFTSGSQWQSGDDFDGATTGNGWSWIQLKHPKSCILNSFTIGWTDIGRGIAIAVTIQGSNDGNAFDNIQSYTFTPAALNTGTVTNPHIPYIYWRVLITKTKPDQGSANNSNRVSCRVGFNTILSNVKVGNAFQKNTTQFEIDMVDYAGYPAAIATNASNKFNILLIKDGKVVTEGLYTFSAAAGSATKAT